MPGSRKGADLHRDPRFALHSATADAELTDGDAKLSGCAVVATRAEFVAYVAAAARDRRARCPRATSTCSRSTSRSSSSIRIGEPADHLVIETWREGRRGLVRVERR